MGRHALSGTELAIEVRQILKSRVETYLSDGLVRVP